MKSLKVNDMPCLFPLDVFRAAVAPLKGDFPYEEMEFAMHSTQNTLPLCLWENMFSVSLFFSFFFWYNWFKEKQSQNLRFSLSIWLVLVCSISVYFSINLSTVTPQSYCQSLIKKKNKTLLQAEGKGKKIILAEKNRFGVCLFACAKFSLMQMTQTVK